MTATLMLHDTLSGTKVAFEPRADAERITLYVCGPTVYNYAHIGNARPAVVFDLLFRVLKALYPEREVLYARNVTDVDDKINAAAAAQGVDISVITDRFAAIYDEDMAALGCLAPTFEPRATAHMAEMVALIERLIAQDAAYVAEGEVLFDVSAFDAYGALAKRSVEDMTAGARVEVAAHKRHPADFVLWKPSKAGEPAWPGPQGLTGRPGWHIECSAMSEAVLGLPIDIHGGGHDLIFPHHTNEIAQSCAAHGAADPRAYARYWMHNGFLDFSGEKMSKSLGNVVLVHDLLKAWPGEVIRWALLSGHYRSPLDWTPELLEQARKNLDRIYGVLLDSYVLDQTPVGLPPVDEDGICADRYAAVLEAAICDDLNTPLAQSLLFGLADELRAAVSVRGQEAGIPPLRRALVHAGRLLGVLNQDPDVWFKGAAGEDLAAEVEALIADRIAARKAKDWAAADRIRDRLTALNVVVMDNPTGATWRMKDPA